MSVKVLPFSPADLACMEVQERHAWLIPFVYRRLGLFRLLDRAGTYAFTAWSSYGHAVACCGILEDGGTWAFLSRHCRTDMITITRVVRKVLELHLQTSGPAYADIDPTFGNAVRWARVLGFRPDDGDRWVFDGTEGRSR